MKKFRTIYSDEFIIYWPSFAGGVGVIIFSCMALFIYALLFILFSTGDIARSENNDWIVLVFILFLLWFVLFLFFSIKLMFTRIKITQGGFSICNKISGRETSILWNEVNKVEFYQEGWRGRKNYRIYLKNSLKPNSYDTVLPVSSVDIERLQSFIPSNLLSNKTYFV